MPLAVTAVSYGADGVSLAGSGKSTTDHFVSMVSRKDCAFWRVLRNRKICAEREDGRDPYRVNYDEPNRQISEDGIAYAPPLHAPANAPAASWTAEAYKPAPAEAAPPVGSAPTVAEAAPARPLAVTPKASPAKAASKKSKPQGHAQATAQAKIKVARKPSPGQVASVP